MSFLTYHSTNKERATEKEVVVDKKLKTLPAIDRKSPHKRLNYMIMSYFLTFTSTSLILKQKGVDKMRNSFQHSSKIIAHPRLSNSPKTEFNQIVSLNI